MRNALFATAALVITAAAASAQTAEVAPRIPDSAVEDEITFNGETWRALVDGRTLTYVIGGRMLGREWYEAGTDRVVYIYWDGRCYDGSWSEQNGVFCFNYDGVHCFTHVRRGGDLIAREVDGGEQLITKIETGKPLSCAPDLTS